MPDDVWPRPLMTRSIERRYGGAPAT